MKLNLTSYKYVKKIYANNLTHPKFAIKKQKTIIMKKITNIINFVLMNGIKLNSNYGLDWNFFYKVREFSDGIDWIRFNINYDKFLSDHKPSFELYFGILNITIVEINVYYLHHREVDEDGPVVGTGQGAAVVGHIARTHRVRHGLHLR